MSVGLMQERPPYIRFEVGTMEYRDNSGVSHSRDVEFIKVTPAGSKDVHEAIADEWIKGKEDLARQNPPAYNPEWAQRFRASFDLWRKGMAVPEHGTSIRSWPVASPSEVKRCIDANVLTVEDLAQINEQGIGRLGMGARVLQAKAATWLKERDGPGQAVARVNALEVENEDLKRQLAQMSETVATLSERVTALAGEPRPKRRGKPEFDDGDAIR